MIQADVINLQINLTDLDRSKFYTGTDGKQYLSVTVGQRKEPDKFGNDLYLSYYKEKGAPTVYIKGNAKSVHFNNQAQQPVQEVASKQNDLPF